MAQKMVSKTCTSCFGGYMTCSYCGGSGVIYGFNGHNESCNICGGTGQTICDVCGGTYTVWDYEDDPADNSATSYGCGRNSSYSYSGTSSSVNSHISTNRQSRYGDVNDIRDVNDALRYLENICEDAEKNYRDLGRSSKKKKKDGVSFWGVVVVAFIVWVLLSS